jgi:deoxyribodipyrimidine photolyase
MQWGALLFIGLVAMVIVCERYARLQDQVRIFRSPAQLQVFDPAKDAIRGPLPAIKGITCEILPCGNYTGKYRQCVVSCILQR